MKNSLQKKYLFILTIAIIFAVSRILLAITDNAISTLLWFCVTLLLLFPIAIYLKNNLMVSSIVVSGIILNLALSIEVISHTLTGEILLGVGTYLYETSTRGRLITFYHLLLFIFPAYIVLKEKQFHKHAWIFSSLHFLIISIITLLVKKAQNCVNVPCELGPLNFIYALKPAFLSLFIFNWIAITLLLFIPTHLLFYYIIKKLR